MNDTTTKNPREHTNPVHRSEVPTARRAVTRFKIKEIDDTDEELQVAVAVRWDGVTEGVDEFPIAMRDLEHEVGDDIYATLPDGGTHYTYDSGPVAWMELGGGASATPGTVVVANNGTVLMRVDDPIIPLLVTKIDLADYGTHNLLEWINVNDTGHVKLRFKPGSLFKGHYFTEDEWIIDLVRATIFALVTSAVVAAQWLSDRA